MKYPKQVLDLIKAFEQFPGIGPRSAERLAFFVMEKQSKENREKFIFSLKEVDLIKRCPDCNFFLEDDKCTLCMQNRENKLLILESPKQILTFESLKVYNGYYFVLNHLLSPVDGINPENLNFENLLRMIEKKNVKEIIFALSVNIYGELTVEFLKEELKRYYTDLTFYRLGCGLPFGSDIEYADNLTLKKALERSNKI